jgi:hypothetical protein
MKRDEPSIAELRLNVQEAVDRFRYTTVRPEEVLADLQAEQKRADRESRRNPNRRAVRRRR